MTDLARILLPIPVMDWINFPHFSRVDRRAASQLEGSHGHGEPPTWRHGSSQAPFPGTRVHA